MITLSWDDWQAVISAPRGKGLDSMLAHADRLEQMLEQHGPNEPMVTLALTDDVYLRSHNWACGELGIPLPPMGR